MSLVRRKLRTKQRVPDGFDRVEDVLNDFEAQLRDAVAEEHEGKRRAELTWKVHRLHWEKNRFLHDLMYVKKVMSRELFDFLVVNKVADGPLIAKWRKPGYELLCSTLAVQRSGTAFGTTALCRVPLRQRAVGQREQPSVLTGCVSCASGDGRFGGPVWWNTPPAEPEEERGGGGGNGGGAGGAAAAAVQHRATWAPVVPAQEQEQAWQQEQEHEAGAAAGAAEEEELQERGRGGSGGGSEGAAAEAADGGKGGGGEDEGDGGEAAATAAAAATRKRAHGDERGPGAQAEEEEERPPKGRAAASGGGDEDGGDGAADDDDDDEEMPDEVRARLAALRGQG